MIYRCTIAIASIFFFLNTAATGQCYPDRHNTTWYDAWTSCAVAPNPNPELNDGHWLLYNFGQAYKLKTSRFWNANVPDKLENGLREIRLDYSMDGVQWNYFGDFELDMATGLTHYQGQEGPDFGEIEAQYLLITALNNYGGPCYSLSEIKIEVDQVVISSLDNVPSTDAFCFNASISPNPFSDKAVVNIQSNCDRKIYYTVYDAFGRAVVGQQSFSAKKSLITLSGNDFVPGVYHLVLTDGRNSRTYKFVRID